MASRTPLLRHLLQGNDWQRVLVFVASRHGAEHVAAKLTKAGFDAAPLHGELSQGARTQALEDLNGQRVRVLVATGIAARGLHIPELSAVVNYDLPRSPLEYLHRIGRTGRAGKKGVALSFISAGSAAHFRLIEKRQCGLARGAKFQRAKALSARAQPRLPVNLASTRHERSGWWQP